ncbi:hypothetical protein [Haloarcula laminariae]|nr:MULTISPECIES: hypothetical protein [Halomicroarcula]
MGDVLQGAVLPFAFTGFEAAAQPPTSGRAIGPEREKAGQVTPQC